jgi:hypothetical protein
MNKLNTFVIIVSFLITQFNALTLAKMEPKIEADFTWGYGFSKHGMNNPLQTNMTGKLVDFDHNGAFLNLAANITQIESSLYRASIFWSIYLSNPDYVTVDFDVKSRISIVSDFNPSAEELDHTLVWVTDILALTGGEAGSTYSINSTPVADPSSASGLGNFFFQASTFNATINVQQQFTKQPNELNTGASRPRVLTLQLIGPNQCSDGFNFRLNKLKSIESVTEKTPLDSGLTLDTLYCIEPGKDWSKRGLEVYPVLTELERIIKSPTIHPLHLKAALYKLLDTWNYGRVTARGFMTEIYYKIKDMVAFTKFSDDETSIPAHLMAARRAVSNNALMKEKIRASLDQIRSLTGTISDQNPNEQASSEYLNEIEAELNHDETLSADTIDEALIGLAVLNEQLTEEMSLLKQEIEYLNKTR